MVIKLLRLGASKLQHLCCSVFTLLQEGKGTTTNSDFSEQQLVIMSCKATIHE